jgi:hypothetical protein
METTINTHGSTLTSTIEKRKVTTANASAYDRLIENLNFSYFGLISMTILIGSIMGAIASMFVFQNNAPFWQFIVALYCAMANLVASIAQAPTKWVVNLFLLSTAVSSLLIVINLF